MKILTISNAAWDDRNSVGNTQSNWFAGWDESELCSLYSREAMPDNKCCKQYYSVTAGDIIRNIFSWGKIGRSFELNEAGKDNQPPSFESKAIASMSGWKRWLLGNIVEMIYSSKIWLNNKLKNYIKEFNPEVVFCFAIAEPYRYNIIKYVKKFTKAKVIMWVADDVWGQTIDTNLLFRYTYRKRYRKLFEMADKVYGVSQMLCDEYSKIFNIPIEPLYKGCDLMPCKDIVGNPLQFVYAGNLLYGRAETLAVLAKQLSIVNENGVKAQLSIYSGTPISRDINKKLNIEGTSKLCGVLPYEEIKRKMSKADIVLHVESFDAEQIKNVRLSFSTKIIDCMQSGSAMMVIGPKGIASVEYPRGIDGVYVVDDLSELKQSISGIIENPTKILTEANKINDYAKKNHEILTVRNKLQMDFNSITSS